MKSVYAVVVRITTTVALLFLVGCAMEVDRVPTQFSSAVGESARYIRNPPASKPRNNRRRTNFIVNPSNSAGE